MSVRMNDQQPTDAPDPRRTVVGNRVDSSLAAGFVRQIVDRAKQQIQIPKAKELGNFRNPKARLRAIQRLRQNNARRFVGAIASPDYYLVDMAMLSANTLNGKQQLGVMTARFDFHDPSEMPASHWIQYPYQSPGTYAVLSEHAMMRLVQRAGAKTFEQFVDLMRPYWAWASLAHSLGQEMRSDFYWFCPVPSGLFAISTDTSVVQGQVFTISTARTYIDRSDMRPQNLAVWDHLAEVGALVDVPRFPSISMAKPEHLKIFGAMVKEGAKWVERHNHAFEKEAAAGKPSKGDDVDPFADRA